MKDTLRFPLKEIIDYSGNRYALARACFKRVYSLLIEKQKEDELKPQTKTDDYSGFYSQEEKVNIKVEPEFEDLLTKIAMSDVLLNKVKFYNEKDENK